MLEITQYCNFAATALVGLALVLNIVVAFSRRTQARVEVATSARTTSVGGVATLERGGGSSGVEIGQEPGTSRGVAWYATAFAVVALILLSVSLVGRAIVTGHGPFTNQHEFAVSFSWGILLAYLYFEHKYKVRSLSLVVLPVVLAMMIYADTNDTAVRPLIPALQNNFLLTVHVATAVVAYGAAAVASGAGVLYLLHPHLSRRLRLPSRDILDEIGYRATVFLFPFLTIMIVLGAIWADIAWGRYWSWDPKETAALVTWLIYGGYLHARVARDWRGERAAWLLVLGFVAVLFTFFGNHFFGGLHSYA